MTVQSRLYCGALLAGLGFASAHAATVTTIDEGPVAGHPSLAIGADGLPVVAYQTLGNKLIVAKCESWDCSDNQRIELSGNYFTQTHFSLAITPGGNPAVGFRHSSTQDLMWVKCVTADCTGGGHVFRTIHAGADSLGAFVDFAYGSDNRPTFAYQNTSHADLLLAQCTDNGCDPAGIERSTVLLGDIPIGFAGDYISLAFRAGSDDPVIGSRLMLVDGGGIVVFHDCAIEPCSETEQLIAAQDGPAGGVGYSMTIGPDDRPLFSYVDQGETTLEFARCGRPDCANGIQRAIIDHGIGTLGFDDDTSIGVRPDGRPVIAYQKLSSIIGFGITLFVAECGSLDCTEVESVRIDRTGSGLTSFVDAELAVDHDGNVVIAWFDSTMLAVKLARCGAFGCESPGDRIFSDGFE